MQSLGSRDFLNLVLRQYRGYDEMPKIVSGLGTAIVSTNKGIISSRDARKLKVGGEVLCSVW